MNRRVAWIVVAAAMTTMLLASVTTAGGVQMWGEPQWDPTPQRRDAQAQDLATPSTPEPQAEPVDDSDTEVPGWIDAAVRVVLVLVLLVGVIALLAAGWLHRPRLRWRRRFGAAPDFEPLPDIAAAIVEEAAARRAVLATGEVRNAIVRCWLQLETDVASVGLIRRPSDTSTEFTEEVLGRYTVDSDAIQQLASLYREARFSDHALDEGARRSALDALDRLHQSLRDVAADAVDDDAAAPIGAGP